MFIYRNVYLQENKTWMCIYKSLDYLQCSPIVHNVPIIYKLFTIHPTTFAFP